MSVAAVLPSTLPASTELPVDQDGSVSAPLTKAHALLSSARALTDNLELERHPLLAGWKWVCLATTLKAAMIAINHADEGCAGFRRRLYDKWIRLCTARPDPLIYWQFIDSERDRSVMLGRPPLRRIANRRGCAWVIEGGAFDGCFANDLANRAIRWLQQYLDDLENS